MQPKWLLKGLFLWIPGFIKGTAITKEAITYKKNMKTHLKLTLYFVFAFLFVLFISIKKEFHLEIESNYSLTDLEQVIKNAKAEGLDLKIESISYEQQEISSIHLLLISKNSASEFISTKPFKVITIGVSRYSPYRVLYDAEYHEI